MIGFPGETSDDFEQTISLMQQVRYETAYMYYFNPREGTAAFSYPDQIPLEVKKERLARIIDLQLAITREEMQKRINQTTMILAEAISRDTSAEILGKTEQDERVVFPGTPDMIGSFQKVKLIELTGNTFHGIIFE
jgi:tRNA-2-methylthio-N6-dimethylallyladenosine synthase